MTGNDINYFKLNGKKHELVGKSAYRIACDHGFEGTEAEWLASLKGEQGEIPNIMQSTGSSLLNVMSQNAVTRELDGVKGDLNGISTRVKNVTDRVAFLEKVNEGNTYDFVTDSTVAYAKHVPSNSLEYATLDKVGGMTGYGEELESVQNRLHFTGLDGTEAVGLTFAYDAETRIITINGTATANDTSYLPMEAFTLTNNKACGVLEVIGGSVSADTVFLAFVDGGAYVNAVNLQNEMDYLQTFEVNGSAFGEFADFALWHGAVDGGNLDGVTFTNYQIRIDMGDEFDKELVSSPVTAVKVQGKNIVPFTNLLLNKVDRGITFQGLGDGGIHVYGTSEEGAYPCYYFTRSITLPIGKYVMLMQNMDGARSFVVKKTDKSGAVSYPTSTFEAVEGDKFDLYLQVYPNKTVDYVIYPQIEAGTTATAFSLYTETIYPIPEAVQQLEGYGLGISETLHNYIDIENQTFVRMVAERDYQDGDANSDTMLTNGTKTIYALDAVETVDISGMFDFDGILSVEGNGFIFFENDLKVPTPNSVTYQVKLTT